MSEQILQEANSQQGPTTPKASDGRVIASVRNDSKNVKLVCNSLRKKLEHTNSTNKRRIQINLAISKKTTFADIRYALYERLKLKNLPNLLRLFSEDGIEVLEEELFYLQDGAVLFVTTQGRDFDAKEAFQNYIPVRVLGEGGFGKVVLAEHRETHQRVALKFVNISRISNARDIDMVFREAEMLKSLQHPGIVQIYACYTLPPMQVVFIMEYLEGGELLQYIQQRGYLPEEEARDFFRQIVEAVRHCHHNRLVHRDLKCENIILQKTESKKLKIIDFGIAGGLLHLDVDQLEIGSLRYMAPEVLLRQISHIGEHIDVWSLGCILFTMVTGHLPFSGTRVQEIISNICHVRYHHSNKNIKPSPALQHLLSRLFDLNYLTRINCVQILRHPWLTNNDTQNQLERIPLEQGQLQAASQNILEPTSPASKFSEGEEYAFEHQDSIENSQSDKMIHGESTPKISKYQPENSSQMLNVVQESNPDQRKKLKKIQQVQPKNLQAVASTQSLHKSVFVKSQRNASNRKQSPNRDNSLVNNTQSNPSPRKRIIQTAKNFANSKETVVNLSLLNKSIHTPRLDIYCNPTFNELPKRHFIQPKSSRSLSPRLPRLRV